MASSTRMLSRDSSGSKRPLSFLRLAGRILGQTSTSKGLHQLEYHIQAQESTRMVKARYIFKDANSLYNMIIWWPVFNLLGVALFTLYMRMKYLFPNKHVGVIHGDQKTIVRCYLDILKLKRVVMVVAHAQ